MRVEYREYLFMVQPVVTGPQPIWGWEVHRELSGHIVALGRASSPSAASDAARLCIDNLKTAKAIGLDVPPTLLARADEVIE